MATQTQTVHVRTCDRCGDKCQKGTKRIVITFDGVREIDDEVTMPTAIDACSACIKSANLWWTGPERRAK